MTVDADSHIIEGEHTWDFLEPAERRFRPVVTEIADTDRGRYWVMEPQSRDIRIFNADFADKSISEGVRDLTDPKARVAKLDELGIDVQVIYPSFFFAAPDLNGPSTSWSALSRAATTALWRKPVRTPMAACDGSWSRRLPA